MVVVVDPDQKDAVISALKSEGETAMVLGTVTDTGNVHYSGALW